MNIFFHKNNIRLKKMNTNDYWNLSIIISVDRIFENKEPKTYCCPRPTVVGKLTSSLPFLVIVNVAVFVALKFNNTSLGFNGPVGE